MMGNQDMRVRLQNAWQPKTADLVCEVVDMKPHLYMVVRVFVQGQGS